MFPVLSIAAHLLVVAVVPATHDSIPTTRSWGHVVTDTIAGVVVQSELTTQRSIRLTVMQSGSSTPTVVTRALPADSLQHWLVNTERMWLPGVGEGERKHTTTHFNFGGAIEGMTQDFGGGCRMAFSDSLQNQTVEMAMDVNACLGVYCTLLKLTEIGTVLSDTELQRPTWTFREAERPKWMPLRFPPVSREDGDATVLLQMVIDRAGRVDGKTIMVYEHPHNRAFLQEAIRAVTHTTYTPATVEGHPIREVARQRLSFVWGPPGPEDNLPPIPEPIRVF